MFQKESNEDGVIVSAAATNVLALKSLEMELLIVARTSADDDAISISAGEIIIFSLLLLLSRHRCRAVAAVDPAIIRFGECDCDCDCEFSCCRNTDDLILLCC